MIRCTYQKTILYYPRHTPDKTIKNTNKERKKIERIKIKNNRREENIYRQIIYKTHKDIYNIRDSHKKLEGPREVIYNIYNKVI